MTTIKAKVPDSLFKQVKSLAKREKISVEEWVATALNAQVSAKASGDCLVVRAKRGNMKNFDRVLAKIRAVEPAKNDRI